jgi:hypothetical protein
LLAPCDEFSEPESDLLVDVLDFLEVFTNESNDCRDRHNALVEKL